MIGLLNLKLAVALFLSLLLVESQSGLSRCSSMRIRREIGSINATEWATMKSVFRLMQRDGIFAKLSKLHTDYFPLVHGGPIFLPFHRQLTLDFENEARKYYADFALPYWDSAVNFRNPASSLVFDAGYTGGDGDAQNQNCLKNGLQSDWNMTYPNPHCLKRTFNGGTDVIKPWYSPEVMTSTLQTTTTLDKFRSSLEFTLHGAVHLGLQGDMTSMQSPNDLIFFLHHSNMDRYWWKWQNASPSNMMAYDGRNPQQVVNATLYDAITGYGNVKVSDVMRLGYGNMCFTYDDVVPIASVSSAAASSGSVAGAGSRNTAANTIPSAAQSDASTSNAQTGGASGSRDTSASGSMDTNASGSMDTNAPDSNETSGSSDSGNSNIDDSDGSDDSDNIAAENGLKSLKLETLKQFFPAIAHGKKNPNFFDMNVKRYKRSIRRLTQIRKKVTRHRRVIIKKVKKVANKHRKLSSRSDSGSNNSLPVPQMPPDHWMMMHGYKKSDVVETINRSVQLINALNEQGYVTPYN